MQDSIFPILIGAVLSLLILYFIINYAVKAACHKTEYFTKVMYRAELLKLSKQGFTMEEITALHEESDDDFWLRLSK